MTNNAFRQFLLEVIQQEVSKITEPKRSGLAASQLGLKPHGGVHNILAVYNQATPEEQEYWGRWYHNAKSDVEDLARQFNLPFPVVAGIVAVLSPGNRWNSNLLAAERLLSNHSKINSYPRQILRAKQILKTGDISLVTGPKVTVFFQSLMNPKLVEKDMVLDSHAINIWRGEKRSIKGIRAPTGAERNQMIQDYHIASEQLGVPVQAVQAVTWYIWKYTGKAPPVEAPTGVYDVSKFRNAQPANDVSLDEVNAIGTGGIVGVGMGNGGTDASKKLMWSGDEPLKENVSSKTILLLVHPDIVFEMTTKSMQAYYKRLEDHLSRFDYVIVHLFYSPNFEPEWLSHDETKNHIYKNYMKMLRNNTHVVKWDNPRFSASFQEELPDYLIDNPNSQIFLAGGYKDLCLKATREMISNKLQDIINDTNATISCYQPLIIEDRYTEIFECVVERTTNNVLDKMQQKHVGGATRKSPYGDTYVGFSSGSEEDVSGRDRQAGIVKKINKNLNKKPYALHDPPSMGISITRPSLKDRK